MNYYKLINMMIFFIRAFIFISLLLASCTKSSNYQYQYHIPEKISDGIEVGTIQAVGIDSVMIVKAINKIMRGKIDGIHSLLIYKDRKLVLEEYFSGHRYQWDASSHKGDWVIWNRNMLHSIMSDTKSITSLCIGIAIDKGFIESVNQSIFDFLPDHQNFKTNGKDRITIEHLLTMTSGLEWYEWNAPYSSSDNPMIGIWYSDKDPISFILDGKLEHEPGTHFSYYGGSQVILGEIIKNATSLTIDDFSDKYLFTPLGIDSVDWSLQFDNGVFEAAGGLKMKPRDMVKVGALFLNNGIWNGERVISEEWIKKSSSVFQGNTSIKIPGEPGKNDYSYSWWIKQLSHSDQAISIIHASGWGGQNIMIIPELNAVIVFTGGNYTRKPSSFNTLERHIIPSFKD